MPRLSADMEFTWCGMISPSVSHCREIGHAKRRGRNFDLLMQKTEYLYDMRDSVKQEQIKELMFGRSSQTLECQKWLNKEREIEVCVNDILRSNKESSDGQMFLCMKLPHDDLINTLDEVTYHLENVPVGHHSTTHRTYKATKTSSSARIGGKTYGQVEKSKNVNQNRKAGTKDETNVDVHAPEMKAAQKEETPQDRFTSAVHECSPELRNEKNLGVAEPETVVSTNILHDSAAPQSQPETLVSTKISHDLAASQSLHRRAGTSTMPRIESKTHDQVENTKVINPKRRSALTTVLTVSPSSFKSMVQAYTGVGSTFGLKDEIATATLGDFKGLTESVPTAVGESPSAADQVPAANIETVTKDRMIHLSEEVAQPVNESEIQQTSCERGNGNSFHAAETVEIISDRFERTLLVHEVDIETLPSQTEGGKMKPIRQSVEAADTIEPFKAGPSNMRAVEPLMASVLRKEDKIPPSYEAESEISHITEDQWLLHSSLDVGRSIKRTVLKIFRCMIDLTAGKIGVHGIGGIGKTTVLKALSNFPQTVSTFDLIILVSVSRSWNIRKIQNEVLRHLSLCREDFESDLQVAEKLFQALSGKKFLLLVDDVWEPIDLQAVGIPDPNSENGCKVIMASRKLDVFHSTDVVRVIEVTTLSREEAWELFYEKVGGIIDSPDIHPFAESIVEGCGGLPLLIIVTGRALSEENNISVWEYASRKFSLPTTGIYHFKYVIQKLKFSFDQLKVHETKSCFLYCCLFSEEQEIDICEFIEYCIQEGLIAGSWANARKRGHDIVDVLICSSLLQLTESGDSFKIHDLIRDLALEILSVAEGSQYLLRSYSRLNEASSPGNSLSSRSIRSLEGSGLLVPEGNQFILRAGAGLTEPPSEEEWKQARMIFLMDNELCTLPARPSCPELSTLFLQRNYRLRVIPMSFFDSMTSLKVLNLSKTRIKSLPNALFKLENLQILILRDCERLVVLPSEVGSLACLEVLDLRGTQISELPDEIGKLTSLRHLEVSFYGSINNSEYVKLPLDLISRGIISRLRSLETLSITVFPGDQRWYKDVKPVINEVSNLTKLRSLCFHFPEAELLEIFLQTSIAWNSQHLTEFKFVVGHDVKRITSRVPEHVEFDYSQQNRCLRFVNGESIPDAVLRTLASSTAFYLDHHLEICSLTNFGVGNINGLNFCIVSECRKIETVVHSGELVVTVLPDLKNLSIHHLWNLTCIWEGIFPKGSFAGLRILTVQSCPKLKYIFSSSVVQLFSKLEELRVEDCPAIEEIIREGEIIDSSCSALPSLKRLTLHYLPGLVNIWRSAWPSLEHISFYDCPKLKNIIIDSTLKNRVIEIKAEKSWWDALEWENSELHLHLQDRFTAICEDDL